MQPQSSVNLADFENHEVDKRLVKLHLTKEERKIKFFFAP